jgi:uncharacterized damage-inducible protein DinB
MYRTIADFTQDWNYEREMTRKVMDRLTDASLSQSVHAEGRTLGRLAWHIVLTLVEMPGQAGLTVEGPPMDAPIPATAAELAETYSAVAARFGETVAARWTGAMLGEEIPMYGEEWTRAKVLGAVVKHEAHHRGQMTVLMRQAGLRVPGVYGPAKEEWAEYGLPTHE